MFTYILHNCGQESTRRSVPLLHLSTGLGAYCFALCGIEVVNIETQAGLSGCTALSRQATCGYPRALVGDGGFCWAVPISAGTLSPLPSWPEPWLFASVLFARLGIGCFPCLRGIASACLVRHRRFAPFGRQLPSEAEPTQSEHRCGSYYRMRRPMPTLPACIIRMPCESSWVVVATGACGLTLTHSCHAACAGNIVATATVSPSRTLTGVGRCNKWWTRATSRGRVACWRWRMEQRAPFSFSLRTRVSPSLARFCCHGCPLEQRNEELSDQSGS